MVEGEPDVRQDVDQEQKDSAGLDSIRQTKRESAPLNKAIDDWQERTGITLNREVHEQGFPVVDVRDQDPLVVMDALRHVSTSRKVVYHGEHNNEFRRTHDIPDIEIWGALDPSHSHQPGKEPSIYASQSLEGGITHAVLEHKLADQDPITGETYALSMNAMPNNKTIEVSKNLADSLQRGDQRFTEGLLYLLPAEAFSKSPNSDHEVVVREKVVPLAVFQVGASLGPLVVNPDTYAVREGNEYTVST